MRNPFYAYNAGLSVFLVAVVTLLACESRKATPNPERPDTLVGVWSRTAARSGVVMEQDTLRLNADGSATERTVLTQAGEGVFADTTVRYTTWRVLRDSTTHAAELCLEQPGVGNVTCAPLHATARSLSLTTLDAARTYDRSP